MDEGGGEAGRRGAETRSDSSSVRADLRAGGGAGGSGEGERGEGEQKERMSAGFCVIGVAGYCPALLLYDFVETLGCLLGNRGLNGWLCFGFLVLFVFLVLLLLLLLLVLLLLLFLFLLLVFLLLLLLLPQLLLFLLLPLLFLLLLLLFLLLLSSLR